MFKRVKGKAFRWLVAVLAVALVLGGVALIRASSDSAKTESTVQADVGGGAWGGGRRPRKKKPEEREKEKDSEQSSEGAAYGLVGGMVSRSK